MPKKQETIAVNGYDKESILALCYAAFQQLQWTVLYAVEDKLLAETVKSWKSYSQQIVVETANNQFTISSEMTHGEMLDVRGRNQKNINAFIDAFETVKASIPSSAVNENINHVDALRQTTVRMAEEEIKEVEEVDKVMNLSGSNLYATYAIIAINVIVFALMALDGAGIFEANGLVHIKWGSNYAPLTLSGDWWRLLSCVFIHFGVIHLAMNMYTLYMAGVYLEPMLGKTKYIAAYLCTGVIASIVSLWWHNPPVNSAGASGAVFGMYGLFLALLVTNLIPKKVRQALLQSIGIFIVYNLVYGMRSGVDNAAHVGGLVSGFAIGYVYSFILKKEKQGQQMKWAMPLIVLLTAGGAYSYLEENKSSAAERTKIVAEVKDAGFKDSDAFIEKYNVFIELQNKALAVVNDTALTVAEKKTKIKEVSLPAWDQATNVAKKMRSLDVSEAMRKKADVVLQYIELRKEELTVMLEILEGDHTEATYARLDKIHEKINATVQALR